MLFEHKHELKMSALSTDVIEKFIKTAAEQAAEQALEIITSRRSSIGVLTEPKVLAHLLALHRRHNPPVTTGTFGRNGPTSRRSITSSRNSEVFDMDFQRELLARKISVYNRTSQYDSFTVALKEVR